MSEVLSLDSCQYLYLTGVSEPHERGLRIVVTEAEALPGPTTSSGEFTEYRPIESTADSRRFELSWNDYVCYEIWNETYMLPGKRELFTGKLLRYFSESDFLSRVRANTYAVEGSTRPLHHIAILCLNHIVEVVATAAAVDRGHGRNGSAAAACALTIVEPRRRTFRVRFIGIGEL
jgi:hypothetical protein